MVKVSIIVPVYNAERHIDKCLKELLNQTYSNYEVIFVNDGSTDNSVAMLESYDNQNIPITILTKENGGQASARNFGLSKAQGEFVCFVDIDDHICIDMIENLVEAQEKENADLVWCDAFIEKNGQIISYINKNMNVSKNIVTQFLLNNASPWCKLVRKDLLINNDLFFPKIRFYEDLAVVPSYALHTNKIAYVDKPLYYYVLHEGSTMNQQVYTPKLECIFDSFNHLKSLFIKTDKYLEYKTELEYLYIEHMLHAASLRFFKFKEGKNMLEKIVTIFKKEFKNWNKNPYFKNKDWKFKLVCTLFYYKQYLLLKILLK